jgi:hypothetical protein
VICSNIAVCGKKADASVSDVLEESQRGGWGTERGEAGHFTDLGLGCIRSEWNALHRLWAHNLFMA